MSQHDEDKHSHLATSRSRLFPVNISTALSLFAAIILILFMVIIVSFVYGSVERSLTSLQEKGLNERNEDIKSIISTFLNERLTVLKDLASGPIIIQSAMQPEVTKENLVDFLKTSSIIGEQGPFAVLDYKGRTIYQSEKPYINYQDESWVHEMMTGKISGYKSICKRNKTFYWRLAVPITYHQKPEGILVAELPVNVVGTNYQLSKLMKNERLELIFKGQTIAAFGPDSDKPYNEFTIPDLGLILHYHIDSEEIIKGRNHLLLQIVIVAVVLTIIAIIITVLLGRHFFIQPIRQFMAYTKSLSLSAQGVTVPETQNLKELAMLAKAFNNMVQEINTQQLKLSKAKNYLEVEVAERTEELRESLSALQQSEENLSITLNSIGDGVITTAQDGTISRINTVAERLTGWSNEDAVNTALTSVFRLYHDESKELVDPTTSVLEQQKTVTLKNPMILKSKEGEQHRVSLTAAPILKPNGDIMGVVLVFHDISSEYAMREALDKRDEILESVALAADVLMKQRCWPLAFDRVLQELGRSTQVSYAAIFKIQTGSFQSGSVKWLFHWQSKSSTKKPDLHTISQNLEANPEFVKKLSAGEFVFCSDINQNPGEFTVPAESNIQSILLAPIHSEEQWWGGIALLESSAPRTWRGVEIDTLRSAVGIIGASITRHNIEQQLRESREALQHANENLENIVEERTMKLKEMQSHLVMQEKMASIGQLASGIAHELNNPVNFVYTNFDTLKENVMDFKQVLTEYRAILTTLKLQDHIGPSSKTVTELEEELHLEFILNDIETLFQETQEGFKRIFWIINSMRDFSHSNEMNQTSAYSLNKGIQDTLVICRNEYKYYADVITHFGDIPEIICIPQQINQVLLNLIVNAAQAIASEQHEQKGTITIETFYDNSTQLVNCKISDDGPGLATGLHDRIFEPFFTTKEPGKGTGLGLSISYDIIVTKHNGQLEVADNSPKGTQFLIKLPLEIEANRPTLEGKDEDA